jgi:hypothetical protein
MFDAQLGHATSSRAISVPLPPGSSRISLLPLRAKRFARSRRGYSAGRASTTTRLLGVLGAMRALQTSHRYIPSAKIKHALAEGALGRVLFALSQASTSMKRRWSTRRICRVRTFWHQRRRCLEVAGPSSEMCCSCCGLLTIAPSMSRVNGNACVSVYRHKRD